MRTVAKKSRKRRMESVSCSHQQVQDLAYFLNDTIVEAIKFLNYEKWSQMRFLCHRINQLIHSNQSKLQPYIVNRLSVEITGCNRSSIVSFNQPFLLPNSRRKWLEDHGYLRDEIPDIPLKKVFAGLEFTDYWNGLQFKIEARFEEPVEENIISKTGSRQHSRLAKWPKTPWVFNAEFDSNYSFRGPILAHFFRLLHHPDAYFREISMFPPMTDKFCNLAEKSPIRCGEFTLQRLEYSLEHSLKWLKDNVRAQNITLCFNYDPIIPNPDLHTLLSEFLLDASICARDGIKLDWLPHPEEFVKTLIKKYEALEVTKLIPSILIEDRCSHEQEFEQCLKSNLVLQDDPNSENKCSDSCTVETCEVQNSMDGRRKMVTPYLLDCRAAAKKSRKRRKNNMDNTSQQDKEPVYFLNDTILEAVKFLNYEKWSKMRFLCHRVNQLIHSNQANLQAFEVKSLSMGEIRGKGRYLITSFDEWIEPADAVKKWFQDRGYSCDETAHIPLEKNLSWGNGLHVTVRAFFDEPAEKINQITYFYNSAGLRYRPLKLFSAEFNAKYEFYGPILSHFFRLFHHPAAYFREVSMFPPMANKYCDMTSHRPIRCDQFTLEFSVQNSLKWLKENVRAKNVTLSFNYNDKVPESDLQSPVSEFILLDASVCARGCIKLDRLLDPVEFVKILLKKYETLEVTKTNPNILIEECPYKLEEYLDSNLVHQDHPPLYDKFCDKCNIKSYKLQNRIDGSRKIIAQVRSCYDSWKCSNRRYMVYIRFE